MEREFLLRIDRIRSRTDNDSEYFKITLEFIGFTDCIGVKNSMNGLLCACFVYLQFR